MKTARRSFTQPITRATLYATALAAALLQPQKACATASVTPRQNSPVKSAAATQAATSGANSQTTHAGSQQISGTYVESNPGTGAGLAGGYQLPAEKLAITINRGLSGLAEEVIPELAQPDYLSFPTSYFLENEAFSCLRVDAGIKNSSISAPVTPRTVTGFFGNNGKVFADVDLEAEIRTTFFWDVEAADGFTACDLLAAVDNVADWFVNLFGGQTGGSQTADDISYEQLTLSASGLTADVDLTLRLDGSALQLASIDQLNVELGSINFSGTPLLQLVTELAAAGVTLIYGDLTQFINDELNTLIIPEQEPRLQEMVNVALQQTLAVEQSIPLGPYSANLSVSPTNLTSSRSANTMTLEFSVDVTSSTPDASCAGKLSFASSPSGIPEQSSSDFDVQIPHWIIARVIYEAGRQGLFCQSTLLPFSTEPWTVQPNGSVRVQNGRYVTTETTPSGFPVSVEHHRGELLVTVPMQFAGDGLGAVGSATADLQAYVALRVPEGDRSVYLVVTEVGLANVGGSLTLPNGRTIDMTSVLDTFLNEAADRLADSLGAIPVLPRITQFSEGLGIEIDQILINDSHSTLGVNIVPVPTTARPEISGSMLTNPQPVRFPQADDVPDFDTGPRDQLDPLP